MYFYDCPVCGQKVSKAASACPDCGCPTANMVQKVSQQQAGQTQQSVYPRSRQVYTPKKKSKAPVITIIIAVLIIVGAALALFFVNKTKKDKKQKEEKERLQILSNKADDISSAGVLLTACQVSLADYDCYVEIRNAQKKSPGNEVIILAVEATDKGRVFSEDMIQAVGPTLKKEIYKNIPDGLTVKYKEKGAKYYIVTVRNEEELAVYISKSADSLDWEIQPFTNSEYKSDNGTSDKGSEQTTQEKVQATDDVIKEYKENYEAAFNKMLDGALASEEFGRLYGTVWYNSIRKVDDEETDKFTKDSEGNFYDDFNEALDKIWADEESYRKAKSIEDNQNEVQNLMNKLINPAEECKESYEAIKEMYDNYVAFTNLILFPSGHSYNTYLEDFNDTDTNMANSVDKVRLYID